ncbi:hypothetical protein OHB49_03860 [Streptomyces sp. NBC_01717]|uniref:hypothetical protein n=1 Tax=Streptomyces sp. NBC_01717 TaxID=2975918 RepID=UPI002E310CE8|nr:hypothetical protein [Streptomyces sp. NBC_01717]
MSGQRTLLSGALDTPVRIADHVAALRRTPDGVPGPMFALGYAKGLRTSKADLVFGALSPSDRHVRQHSRHLVASQVPQTLTAPQFHSSS